MTRPDAVDPDYGVETVYLFIDGQQVGSDGYEPWTFEDVVFPEGTYELVARAQDYSGNEADSLPITVIVGDGGDGDPTTTGDGDEDGMGGEDSGDDSESDSDSTTGFTTGFPGDDSGGVDEEGCACSSSNSGGAGTMALGLFLLVGLRRRERA